MEYVLFGKDGKRAVVKTATDKAEYLASGFYSVEPNVVESETVIENVEKEESKELKNEEDIRELYFQKFGKNRINRSQFDEKQIRKQSGIILL